MKKVLYAIVCGAPPARDVGKLVDLGQAAGWDVFVIASPAGLPFLDVEALTAQTGHTVRSAYADSWSYTPLPPAQAMIAPATCNTIAKWAAGISDTLPLGVLVEAADQGIPIVVVPFASRAQLSFPAVKEALGKLASWGADVLVGDKVLEQHQPGTSYYFVHLLPWKLALDTAEQGRLTRLRNHTDPGLTYGSHSDYI